MSSKEDVSNELEVDAIHANIDDLLKKHAADVAELRLSLGKDLPVTKKFPYYDDIWLLRYILSFKTAKKALKPAQICIAWRKENQEFLDKCADDGAEFKKLDISVVSNKYQVAGLVDCLKDGGPFVVIRPSQGDPEAMYTNMTYAELHQLHYGYRELSFRRCDRLTRSSRIIVKQILIFDMDKVSFSKVMDRRGGKVYGPVSKACANYYPQLQSKFVMINTPSWMSIVWQFVKRIMPKRNVDKMAVCPGNTLKGDVSKCPYVKKYFDVEKLPDFLGGKCPESKLDPEVTGALLVSSEDDEATKGFTDLTVKSRSSSIVEVEVAFKGVDVKWTLGIAGYGVKMSAVLVHGEFGGEDGSKFTPSVPEKVTILRKAVGGDEKLKADDGIAKGEWFCPSTGLLKVTFDNRYSMLRSKSLKYKFEICEPEADLASTKDESKTP